MRSVILTLMALTLGGFLRPGHIVWAQAPVSSGTIITVAGSGMLGFAGDGGQAVSASFSGPQATTVGPDGTLYIVDSANNRIRAVDPTTGIISTVAGNGSPIVEDGPNGDGGPATSARISDVLSLSVDRENNILYLPEFSWGRVRQVNLSTGIINNFAGKGIFDNEPGWNDGDGGLATFAYFIGLVGVDVGPDGDVFTTDTHRLRRVDSATGIIARVAGIEDEDGEAVYANAGDGGPAIEASFGLPHNLKVDSDGNVFVLDVGFTHTVRRIDAATGIITRIAGGGANPPTAGGQATDVNFTNGLWDIAPDNAGNLFIAEGRQIFKLTLATGELTTYAGTGAGGFAGDGGPASDAQFFSITGLAAVPGGGLLITDYDNHRVRYIAPDSINLVGDAGQTEFHLPWVSALAGDLNISDNSNVTTVSMGGMNSLAGSVEISGNSSAGSIDLGSLQSAGSVDMSDNSSAGSIELGALETVDGAISMSNNQAAGSIDLSALVSAGSITITDNGNASVSMGSLENVAGSITIESTGMGTFSMGDAEVAGSIDLTLDGYATAAASTADGETAVTMINDEATMEVTLPDGAFTSETPVAFSITNLAGGVETIGDDTITHLGTYAFEFAIPTLNSDAELNFEIDLAAMEEPDRLSLLNLLDAGALLTLGVRGDAPEAELQLFDVCSGGGPVVDACVVVQWLDENRMLLDPLGGIDPAVLRLEGLVGHFSTYSFVAVGLAGDYNHNGVVDAADYVVWRDTLGQSGPGLAADGNNSGTIDAGDYDVWKSLFGTVSPGIGAGGGAGATANAAVPEPEALVLLVAGMLALSTYQRAAGS